MNTLFKQIALYSLLIATSFAHASSLNNLKNLNLQTSFKIFQRRQAEFRYLKKIEDEVFYKQLRNKRLWKKWKMSDPYTSPPNYTAKPNTIFRGEIPDYSHLLYVEKPVAPKPKDKIVLSNEPKKGPGYKKKKRLYKELKLEHDVDKAIEILDEKNSKMVPVDDMSKKDRTRFYRGEVEPKNPFLKKRTRLKKKKFNIKLKKERLVQEIGEIKRWDSLTKTRVNNLQWYKLLNRIELQTPLGTYLNDPKFKSRADLNFFGQHITLVYNEALPTMKRPSKRNIASFFEEASKSKSMLLLVEQLNLYAHILDLNDWNKYLLFKQAMNEISEGNQTTKDALLAYLLTISGYDIKLAYQKKNTFLLYNAKQKIYNLPVIEHYGKTYYVIGQPSNKKLNVFQESYQLVVQPLNLILNSIPKLGAEATTRVFLVDQQTYRLSYSNSVNNLLARYPTLGLHFKLYTPLSKLTRNNLRKEFSAKMTSFKTNRQKVQHLLTFVHHAFKHNASKHDEILFAEEALKQIKLNNESSAVLFMQMVDAVLGLKTIAFDYNGRILVGVRMKENNPYGLKIFYDQQIYTVCDPNYVNARVGVLMPGMEKQIPRVIQKPEYPLLQHD